MLRSKRPRKLKELLGALDIKLESCVKIRGLFFEDCPSEEFLGLEDVSLKCGCLSDKIRLTSAPLSDALGSDMVVR